MTMMMMMKKAKRPVHTLLRYALVGAVALLAGVLHAQPTTMVWAEKPERHQVEPAFAQESAITILDARQHAYVQVGEDMMVKVTTHKIIRVNDEKGVAMYNRVYIPLSDEAKVDDIRARVITPAGKVINLPQEKILDVEEEGQRYRKFALEGVETGSEIEYMVQQTRDLYLFGIEVFQSENAPVQQASLVLKHPVHLMFTARGYNGMEVLEDKVYDSVKLVHIGSKNIPAMQGEKYGQTAPHLQHAQYKLSYNLNRSKDDRLYTWDQLAELVYSRYNNLSSKEKKAVEQLVKTSGLSGSMPEEERIIGIEDFLKTRFSVNEEGLTEKSDMIEEIIRTKVASEEGFIRLFVACMNELSIRHELVFPNKRNELQIDETLENYRLIDDLVFYFPGSRKFLEPVNVGFRYPFIDPYWAGTRGLFLKPTLAGNMVSVYASFGDVDMQPYEANQHNIEVDISLNATLDSALMHSRQLFTGYNASLYRPAFLFLPADKLKEFNQEVMQSVSKSKDIKNIKTANTAMTDGVRNKPLIIEGDIASAELVEQAGNKTLLKIGEVIGPQVEMYQEKPRQLPVSIEFPHILDRLITLTIPEGYTIKNPEDVVIRVPAGLKPGQEGDMGFESSYTLQGNKMVIKLHEYYKQTDYPMSQFKAFQEVINAAADFNKVVLVLQKK